MLSQMTQSGLSVYTVSQNNVPFQSLKKAAEFPIESILGEFDPAFLAKRSVNPALAG